MLCSRCQREARGFEFDARLIDKTWKREPEPACSMKCLDKIHDHWKRTKDVIDPTENEIDAAMKGGNAGGQYLDSIGKTDLATLDAEQWQTFLLCVIGGYTEALAEKP